MTKDATATSGAPALVVSNLAAGYGRQQIVHGVSFEVGYGQVLAVIGANGSGKSTIAKAVMGLCRVFSGSVRLGDTELAGRKSYLIARAGLGYVPQLDNVFADMTVRENLEMGGYGFKSSVVRQRIDEVVAVFPELAPTMKKKARQLSGGQRGMVGVGRALMGSPRVILFDEPTAGLAPRYRTAVWDHIVRVAAAGVGVLVVEQDARAAVQHSERCCVVATGSIVEEFVSETMVDATEVAGFYLGV